MKTIMSLICEIFILIHCHGQTVELTTDKTTSLIFPYTIQHVDRGSKDVLVQAVKEAGNILLLKAAIKNFISTNLSVITSDGSIYSFPVQFSNNPSILQYRLQPLKDVSLQTYANAIADNPQTMHGIHNRHWQVGSKVTGLYVKNNIIYYQLKISNESSLDYDIDFIRFYIRDKRKGKRTASQENELVPLCTAGNLKQVKANSSSVLVFALDKFTVPDAKYLAIEINEHNGGRHLSMRIPNRKIVRARILSDLY